MMPDDVAQACHDGEGVDASAMHGFQSVWVAHWMHTSCRSAAPNCDQLSVGCEIKEVKEGSDDAEHRDLLGGSDVAVDGSMCAAPLGEVDKDTKLTFINEADCGKSKKPSFGSKSFPIFNVSQKTDGMLSRKKEWNSVKSEIKSSSGDDGVSLYRTGGHLPSTSVHAPPKTETSVRECQPLSQAILPGLMKTPTPTPTEQNELAVSTSVWNDSVKSDLAVVPSVRDKGKGLLSPLKSEQREIYQSSFNLASQEHFTTTKYHSFSSLSIREKKTGSLLDPQRSYLSRWIQSDISHLPQDPIESSDDELCFVQGQHHKILNLNDANITNQTASLESIKSQKIGGGSSLVPQLLHDVETMKIYTSIDAAEESLRGGHPKISQTTHQFLMSKNVDVNLSNKGQLVRESIAPTKFKVNSFSANLDFSSPMSDHGREGRKPEAFGSSIKCDGKEIVQDLRSLKNESSAETDTMDIHALHENHLPGICDVPLQTNKYSKDSQNLPLSLIVKTSARENAKAKSWNTTLPDMNEEPHEELTPASPVVDKETSTSRTNSLGVEHLLSHADEQSRSKSGNSSLGPNPCGRWVKRLKLCTLGSAHGTKNEKLGECSSHEKVNNIVTKNMQGTNPIMDPKVVYHAEEQMVPDLPDRELTNAKSSLNEVKRAAEITLSHPWIQRWNHPSSASFPKSQLHDPKSSNTELEELQKEQFPSIAAMALMGKAMNNLNPSQVMKKGPVIVWNAKGF